MLLYSPGGSVPRKSDTRAMFAFLFRVINTATSTQRFCKSGPANCNRRLSDSVKANPKSCLSASLHQSEPVGNPNNAGKLKELFVKS